MERDELQERLVDRALDDEGFRALLLEDPRRAIAEELGAPLPDDLRVEVVEEQPGTLYLVLPAVEIDDAALDDVTGGIGGPGSGNEQNPSWDPRPTVAPPTFGGRS